MHERIRTVYDALQKGTIVILAVSVLLVSLQYSLIWNLRSFMGDLVSIAWGFIY
ncbi:hypothetical protein GBAR_LOCUS3136, partial [Geodia barretti]